LIRQNPPAVGTPPAPQISPDGHYWWDGQAWQPMPAAAASAAAPALAADQPAADQPAWLAQPAPLTPEPAPQAMPPEPAYQPPLYEPNGAPAPAWQQPGPSGPNRGLIYTTGLLLIVVIGIGGFAAYSMLKANTSNVASVQASPSPVISDYERADRFLNVDLGPPLVETNQALPAVTKNCTSSLPPPCKDALITLNNAMIDLDKAMQNNQRDIPNCIGPAVAQFKADWEGMEQGVSQAIGGFEQSNRTVILQGLQKFGAIAQYLKPDVNRINTSQQSCPKTV
jgi:hypothetical protein